MRNYNEQSYWHVGIYNEHEALENTLNNLQVLVIVLALYMVALPSLASLFATGIAGLKMKMDEPLVQDRDLCIHK